MILARVGDKEQNKTVNMAEIAFFRGTLQFAHGVISVDNLRFVSNTKQVEVDGQQCMIDIFEISSGLEEYSPMRDLYMKHGQGFVLVYSITSQSSFNDLGDFHDRIISVKGTSDVPMVLVGNKCDLEDERIVGKDQGQALAKQFGNCTFLETSAKTKINVTEIFFDLVRQINRKTPEVKKPRRNIFRRCVIL